MNQANREQWLIAAVDHLTPIFERMGYSIPPVKVSVGFPSTGGKGRHLGQCWSSKSSEDGMNQIFIAPHLETPIDFLDTLVHELVHAVDDCESGHGDSFKKIALDVGLKGPMRSAGAGDSLREDLIRIAEKLGSFPHGRLRLPVRSMQKAPKRPGAKCTKCGYEVVMLKKHLHLGPPICPKDIEGMEATGDWNE
ncbi:SprT-like domain-containing protein [Polynucleobacter sp. JS-JIR-II-b4]|uniref:SprT-like domain-containing protein n=1 Tax=Polynucleobacter sp. JS-JIR-II-b4 TaxID=1758390 RepID=UPI001BFDBFFC|nr:SprT-like domain-containing protein [Polynucleobacter sp. JS-JIR-II-b4]QWE02055.1 SprT-like domain-containing protein [Polynucleobacter sp. JS-JIR-II-b4]